MDFTSQVHIGNPRVLRIYILYINTREFKRYKAVFRYNGKSGYFVTVDLDI